MYSSLAPSSDEAHFQPHTTTGKIWNNLLAISISVVSLSNFKLQGVSTPQGAGENMEHQASTTAWIITNGSYKCRFRALQDSSILQLQCSFHGLKS